MKYKVTITSTDLTGHEDDKVNENVTIEGLINFFNSSQSQLGKTILIEPMPEKKKVTVWFYVCKNNFGTYSASNTDKMTIIQWYNNDISLGRKVSEIKSMEVEI
jgi:hypothetical protein